jgi:hypothetical protein
MNSTVSIPEVGQWYERWDTGELFQVVHYDCEKRLATISREAFGGGLSTLDEAQWDVLPLEPADPPRTRMREPGVRIVQFVEWVEPPIG